MSSLSSRVEIAVQAAVKEIRAQLPGRAYRASNELRTAELRVLRGRRSGRVYRVPATRRSYRASAPGEVPAQRTGTFRLSWHTAPSQDGTRARIESGMSAGGHVLGELLEKGTSRMAPRPYQDKIIEKALPAVKRIYEEPYE